MKTRSAVVASLAALVLFSVAGGVEPEALRPSPPPLPPAEPPEDAKAREARRLELERRMRITVPEFAYVRVNRSREQARRLRQAGRAK